VPEHIDVGDVLADAGAVGKALTFTVIVTLGLSQPVVLFT
jgi:hypothetical protein